MTAIDYCEPPGERFPSRAVASRTVANEVEHYSSSIAGIDIEAIRTGAGVGPTHVLATIEDRLTFTASTVGFPMLSRTTVPDERVIVAYIRSATPGSRWCEIDLEPGDVLLYGSEAEHTARNLPGLDFMFAITDVHQLAEHAEKLGSPIETPPRGCVRVLSNPPKNGLVPRAFRRFADVAASGEYPTTVCCDDVLRAMTHTMSQEAAVARTIGCTGRIDSRRVVHACIEYADSIGRIPSISELCLTAHVSERRLREAFIADFGIPPSRFFRAWALDEAHRRLMCGDAQSRTVTEVAVELGFGHLGRFSGHYKEIYGQTPSATLHHEQRRPSLA